MKKILYSAMILSLAFAGSCKKETPGEEEKSGEEIIPVENITLNQAIASLLVGDTLRLVPTIHPTNATNDTISWASSDTTVATVENGLVTAKWFGQTTITVTTKDGNKTATCVITTDFKPGEHPTLTTDAIQSAYPAPDQQYFLKGEHPNGFIKLTSNYGFLFTGTATTIKVRLRSEANETLINTTWNANDFSISWIQPDLNNNTLYTLELVSVSNGSEETVIWSYDFRTSMFNTFAEKMAQLTVTSAQIVSILYMGNARLISGNMSAQEGFDEVDIVGTDYTQNKPLIIVRSAMTDSFFINRIYPMLYEHYPFDGAVTYSREEGQSIIPDWDIIKRTIYDYGTLAPFPWVHYLGRTYYEDYYAAWVQVAQASQTVRDKYLHLFNSGFPILPRGADYDLNFAYTLPNGVVTDTTVQKTFAVLP
ncbi:MAG: Ig-like domain-containing protein [Bacteroidales bacterium]|nr:Ig-like domain-containing protein [Bacteroidales bacterium]